jgi:hypothetical protein
MIPILHASNIKIALNVNGANWSQCSEKRAGIIYEDAKIIDRIIAAGGNVSYLTMQSTLSKTEGGNSESLNNCLPYPDSKRIQDITRYITYMKQRYPAMQFGLTDADATKGNDYKNSLRKLRDELALQNLKLDYIEMDNIAKFLDKNSVKDLKEVEQVVRDELGIRFGLVYTANKFTTHSNQEYYDSVMSDFTAYQKAGGTPGFYMVTSWFAYPEHFLPDNGADSYTLMRTAADIGERISAQ